MVYFGQGSVRELCHSSVEALISSAARLDQCFGMGEPRPPVKAARVTVRFGYDHLGRLRRTGRSPAAHMPQQCGTNTATPMTGAGFNRLKPGNRGIVKHTHLSDQ